VDPRVQEELDRQERERAAAERAAEERRVRMDIVETFSMDAGRRTLQQLRKEFYDVDGFVRGCPEDSHAIAAQRNVVLRILTVLAEEADVPKDRQESAET
jgi:hypothetical protein